MVGVISTGCPVEITFRRDKIPKGLGFGVETGCPRLEMTAQPAARAHGAPFALASLGGVGLGRVE